jgi:predicted unusual protein kinase regulating ubiquinone biosynthesis (AarF/ABC1/UbiB family)
MKNQSWRGFKRFWTVVFLFVKIFWSFYSLRFKKLWHATDWLEAQKAALYVSQARLFRETAVDLGGLLIKLGQFFSTRVDILPPSSINELSTLQDEVKPVPFDQLIEVARQEFSKPLHEVFLGIDNIPRASASLGQVHRWQLHSGETVAIKIQRPGIEELVAIDLKAVGRVIALIKRFTDWERFVDLDAIYREFSDTLWAELNYIQEGHNAERIAENSKDDPDLIVPEIYWEYTTRRVLTMEYLDGVKVTDFAEMDAQGIDRQQIAGKLLQVYVKQILIDGFFHADPHPGNLFARPGNKLVMIDFGMMGSIPPDVRDTLVEMVFALVNRDFARVVEYLTLIGFIRPEANQQVLIRAMSLFLEQSLGKTKELSQTDLNVILKDLEVLLYEQPFQVPANFTFLGRALGTLYGICVKLYPDISFIDVGRPYLEQIAPEKESLFKIVKDKAGALGLALVEIPPLAEKVLRQAEIGELTVNIPMQTLTEQMASNTRSLNGVSWMLGFGFTALAASYLKVNGETGWALGSVLLSLVFLLAFILSRREPKGSRRMLRHPEIVPRKKRRGGKSGW